MRPLRRKRRLAAGVLLSVSLAAATYLCAHPAGGQASGVVLEDIFGRAVNSNGIVLVDWEGHMANPAIKVFVKPPSNIAFPATAVLSSNAPRLYFDLSSTFGASGPGKTVTLSNASSKVPIRLSIFPDRDTADEDYTLTVQLTDANGAQSSQTISVHVVDQDKTDPQPFQITLDFSKDQTGFFSDAAKRNIVQQAANDWAYFFAGMNLDTVPVGAETTFIWDPDGFNTGHYTTNSSAYKGFLLYAYGIHHDELRSGGEPSFYGGFQTAGGGSTALPLKRSGGVEIETQGNFNTLGWFLTTGDNDWHVTGNLGHEQNDLYSIAHHEIGHALIFNPAYTEFGDFKNMGSVQDAAVLAYQSSHPAVDPFDHLDGSADQQSRRGAFGYEYFGDVPRRRWLITKLDLLVAQAIGYQLRPTSAFVPLSLQTNSLPVGTAGVSYSAALQAQGGIPFYNWTIDSGALPAGLSLNSFTGAVTGTPTQTGTFNFTVRVRDYVEGSAGVTRALSITINPNTTPPADLSLAMTDSPDPVNVSDGVAYAITVTNNGPNPATGVRVTDTLPAGTTFVPSTSPDALRSSANCTLVGGTVTCSIGSLAVSGSGAAQIVVKAPSSATALNNSAAASGNEPDPDTSNNTSSTQTTVRNLSLSLSPTSIVGTKPSIGTVTLAKPAPPGGAVVQLASNNTSVATVPASATLAAGTTSKTFNVTTKAVASTAQVEIGATYQGEVKKAILQVTPPQLTALALSPASITPPCQTSALKVTLSGKAPVGGVVVNLTNANPAAIVPASVTVPAGATSVALAITASAVTAKTVGNVTATPAGANFGTITYTKSLTVLPNAPKSLMASPATGTGPYLSTLTMTLACPARAGGQQVLLSSNNAGVARPVDDAGNPVTSVVVPEGQTVVTFKVQAYDVAAPTTATITAKANNLAKTVKLTVN